MLEEVNKIKSHYAEKQETKFEKLKRLDRQVKKPAKIFAGFLFWGIDLCLKMYYNNYNIKEMRY